MGVAGCWCRGWAATWKAGHNKLTSSRRQAAGPENCCWKPENIFTATTKYFYTSRLTAELVSPWLVRCHRSLVPCFTVDTREGRAAASITPWHWPLCRGQVASSLNTASDVRMVRWLGEVPRPGDARSWARVAGDHSARSRITSSTEQRGQAGRGGGWRRQWRPGGAAFYPLRQTHLAAGPSTTHWARFGDGTL